MKRRMLTTDVTSEGRFLRMSMTAQALWMHLLANADDDGCVDAYTIMRMVGAKEDDLVLLKEREYITVLDEQEYILWITNFQEFNWIDARYKEDSKHLPLLRAKITGLEIVVSTKENYQKNRYKKEKLKKLEAINSVNTAHVQHMGSTGVPPAKVRLGKDSINTTISEHSDEKLASVKKEKYKDNRFPAEWYQDVLDCYCEAKQISPVGDEWTLLKREIKQMFVNGRTSEEVCLAIQFLKKAPFTWTIRTVRLKMPEILAKVKERK